ncbi:MAG: MFS transporter [Gordonia sp. (in: high G+C Gram-positive bacteria)]
MPSPEPATASAARRWTILVCALVAAMTATTATAGVAYVIPALHHDGMSLSTAAVLAAVPTVGMMVAIIAWGAALDRFGERRVLMLSLSITLAGTVWALLAVLTHSGDIVLGAALLVGGLGSGAANGASGRVVVGWFPAEQRGTAMGIRQMAQPLGIAVCALTMPLLAEYGGIGAALAVPVVITVVGLAAVVFGIADPAPAAKASTMTRPANPYRTSGYLARIHGFSVLLVIPQSMLWTFVPAWLMIAHHWSALSAGALITVTQVFAALGRIVAGRVSDVWRSRMRPVRLIAVIAAASCALLALTDWLGSPVAAAVMVLATIATVADNGLAFTAIAESAGPSWSGRALGVQNTAQYLTIAATTPVLGRLIESAGYPTTFAVVATAPILALPLIPNDPHRPSTTEEPLPTAPTPPPAAPHLAQPVTERSRPRTA